MLICYYLYKSAKISINQRYMEKEAPKILIIEDDPSSTEHIMLYVLGLRGETG